MDFELKIKGTPAKFAVMVDLFNTRLRYRDKNNTYKFHVPGFAEDIPPNKNLVSINFENHGSAGWGWITAQSTPDDNTLLVIWVKDEEWSNLEPVWLLLNKELERNDWIFQDQPTATFEDEEENGPWNVISDPRERMIVRLLHKNKSSKEIAYRVGPLEPKTVDNILSNSRKLYGIDVVPYRKPRRNQ